MKKRIVILGIDGLEYDLVEEWGLKNLMQRSHCRTSLKDFPLITTPLIWAAMITGQKIDAIEKAHMKRVRYFAEQRESQEVRKQYLAARIGSRILPESAKRFVIRHFLPDPFAKTFDYVRRNGIPTIFDNTAKHWTNGIPSYGLNVSDEDEKDLAMKAVKGDIAPLYKHSMETYRKDREELFSALERDHEIIFWYTFFLDKLEHFLITKKMKIMKVYMELNSFVGEVSSKLSEGDVLIVVSDHGMKVMDDGIRAGAHSDHGFFSSSTGDLIARPQDLFELVNRLYDTEKGK